MITKVVRKYRETGAMGTIWTAVKRLPGSKSMIFYYVYEVPAAVLQHDDGGEFAYKVSSEVPPPTVLADIDCSTGLFQRRLAEGHFHVIAYDGNQAVASLWAHEGTAHVEQQYGFIVPMSADQLFYYDSNTRSQWRRKGILRGMLAKLATHGRQELNKKDLVAVVETTNFVSQVAHQRLGFRKKKLMFFVKILGQDVQLTLRKY